MIIMVIHPETICDLKLIWSSSFRVSFCPKSQYHCLLWEPVVLFRYLIAAYTVPIVILTYKYDSRGIMIKIIILVQLSKGVTSDKIQLFVQSGIR